MREKEEKRDFTPFGAEPGDPDPDPDPDPTQTRPDAELIQQREAAGLVSISAQMHGFRLAYDSKPVEDMIEASAKVHFFGFHMDGLKVNNNEKSSTSSATDNVHKQPFIIGVAGGAAFGKTTVCDMIIEQFHDHHVVLVYQVNIPSSKCSFVKDYSNKESSE
ncbi:hypothetical protein V6N11_068440 [Hibiscus sabdariffa]|uniref:Uncharacterized protein n=1 Tax=Hibiscus sabdariffa TaxID=183260 RepID=A0ABR2A5I6_9ROSI